MKRIYLDYNATAPLQAGFLSHLENILKSGIANPSSVHAEGQRTRMLVEEARKAVLAGLDASNYNLIFTSGATEANNQVIQSLWQNRGQRRTIVLTEVEHSCVYNTALELQKQGAVLKWLHCDKQGRIDLEAYRMALTDDVVFVSVMLVQNETGFVFPIREMNKMAHEHDISFLCDVVCAVGKIPVSLNELGCDFATFSSHKFGGLQGVGGILHHKNARLNSFIFGGPQEKGKRAGTENISGILSTSYALNTALNKMPDYHKSSRQLRETILKGISKIYPAALALQSENQIHQTINVAFPGLNGQLMLTNLDLEGVSVSHGSACASGSLELSRALLKIGLSNEEAMSALRISFGPNVTEIDALEFLNRLNTVVSRMVGSA